MVPVLHRIGSFCARRHRVVIAAWLAAAVILIVCAGLAGERNSDNLTLPGTDSTKAFDILEASLPDQAYGTNPVVLAVDHGKLTDESNRKAIAETLKALRALPDVREAVDPLGSDETDLLSKDGRIAYIPVTLRETPSDLTEAEARDVLDAAETATDHGIDQVALAGYAGDELSTPSTDSSEAIGILAAIIILIFAFGTVYAAGLPIITAVLGLVSSLAIIRLLGHVAEIPDIAPTLATMIGLGVGIDYALFIVTRHKRQLRDGMAMDESIARATAMSGSAIVFAGGTVVVALCSLAAARIPIVTAMGFASAVSVLTAVLAAITLLPALLGALGPRINSLRVKLGRTHPDDHKPHGWRRWAKAVSARPWRATIAGIAILAVLATPLLNLRLGQTDDGNLPESTTARQAFDLIAEGFGPGTDGPMLVAVNFPTKAKPDGQLAKQVEQQQEQLDQEKAAAGDTSQIEAQEKQLDEQREYANSPSSDPRLTELERKISATNGVASVSPATVDGGGDSAVFTVTSKHSPDSQATSDLVDELRSTVIPEATSSDDLEAYVGGETAGYIDLADRISDRLPSMIAIVVALSCLILLVAFRSIVIPLKAAAMNLLSVAAAYGIVTWVFQEGHGATLLGLDGAVPIASFVPLLMFAILFGLSMDYEVFLLTQIEEHYREDGDPTKAVVDGLANTGRVITSAALIMVCVFTSFVLNGDPVVKEFGVGLAVAIAIDATLVRCVLVPAIMTLLGKASWWLPGWLDRLLPQLGIEREVTR